MSSGRLVQAVRIATVLAAAWLACGEAARAKSVQHMLSREPHWNVGLIDPRLSDACRRQRFNQISDEQRFIGYRGKVGTGVTGIAKKGWNLRDPDGRATADATYHFAEDGLSTCRVYVAREKTQAR